MPPAAFAAFQAIGLQMLKRAMNSIDMEEPVERNNMLFLYEWLISLIDLMYEIRRDEINR
jgi:hypothetical protein